MSKILERSVAILYQAVQPPIIDGARKPMKPGGYSDSGADIAYNLRNLEISVITPIQNPNPHDAFDWVFPDTDKGIETAINKGADMLWANTVLFSGHPLEKIKHSNIFIVGQLPSAVQKYDNKWTTHHLLKTHHLHVVPSCLISSHQSPESSIGDMGLEFPLIIKPVRGRGSAGVIKVETLAELKAKATQLFAETEIIGKNSYNKYGQTLMVEQFLPNQEVTITVMPPGHYTIKGEPQYKKNYWSLPIVKRFNHIAGIAPYSGVVAVVRNSALLSPRELEDPCYHQLQQECEQAAALVAATAPIRIDCRAGQDNQFYLFDLNMKPNITGPGRPGREDQDSLILIAARSPFIGWNYEDLLMNMYLQAWPANRMQVTK